MFSFLLKDIQPSSVRELIKKMLENNPENRITSPEIVLRLEKLKKEVKTRQFNEHWSFFFKFFTSKISYYLFVNLYLTWDLITDGNQIIQIIGNIKC
jgi:hypothetical protein